MEVVSAGENLLTYCENKASLLLPGLWLGMLVCAFIPCMCSITYIVRMNWKQVAEEVSGLAYATLLP